MSEEVIPSGKIKCFITGKLRKDTPEERVRQDVARSLVEEYGYDKSDIEIEFPIKMGKSGQILSSFLKVKNTLKRIFT